MGRARRGDAAGTWFHVVNRGAARADIFFEDRDRIEFGRLLGEAHVRFEIDIHAYCLMSNHYHLLVESPDGGLSNAMHLVGGVYARHLNERLGRDGPVFRGRFFARPVLTPEYMVRLVRYIHRNPTAFLSPERLDSYRWSSLRTYLGHRRRPDWLRTDVVSSLVGGERGMRSLVEVAEHVGGPLRSSEDIAGAVDLMLDEHLGEDPAQGVARTVMTSLLDRLDEQASMEVRALLAFPTLNAERSARSRARRRIRTTPTLEHVIDSVLDLVA